MLTIVFFASLLYTDQESKVTVNSVSVLTIAIFASLPHTDQGPYVAVNSSLGEGCAGAEHGRSRRQQQWRAET